MRIVTPERGTSFYESFSDLIFGTLVLFIVIVMALVLELRSATDEMHNKMNRIVSPNRFSGASDTPYWYFAHVRIDNETYIVWAPASLIARFQLNRREGGNDPVLEFCQMALKTSDFPDGISLTSAADYCGMEKDLSLGLARRMASNHFMGIPTVMFLALKEKEGDLSGWTPQRLKEALGGLELKTPRQDLAAARDKFIRETYTAEGNDHWYKDTLLKIWDAVAARGEEAPFIRFRVTPDKKVKVGDYIMPAATFRNILRSIKPGKGFYVEYLTMDGKREAPPDWVFTDILEATGITGRLVSEEALAEMRKRQQQGE